MGNNKRVLLHCCCAPDTTVPVSRLHGDGYEVVCAFFGSNIHPEEEYRWRLEEMRKVAAEKGARLWVLPYEPEKWMRYCGKLAGEQEGKSRCGLCFSLQLLAAAQCAEADDCGLLCTTLTISPHKNPLLIRRIGEAVARKYALTWLDRTWRKNGGFLESVQESRRMGLRRQTYCGCVYSRKEDETR
jgi:predicted adenine nucleotide alpha hydrolase (AANH) superfamily ATPase